MMISIEYDAAVSAFIRAKGVTRCPTACILPTQATISDTDRAALETHAAKRESLREQSLADFKRIYRLPARAAQ